MPKPCGFNVRAFLPATILLLSISSPGCDSEHAPVPSAPKSIDAPQPPAAPAVERPFVAHGYGVENFCPEICRRTHALGCRAMSDCDQLCRGAFADMVCPQLLQPAMECALSLPLSSWFCSPDGIAAVKDGSCEREQVAYEACLAAIK